MVHASSMGAVGGIPASRQSRIRLESVGVTAIRRHAAVLLAVAAGVTVIAVAVLRDHATQPDSGEVIRAETVPPPRIPLMAYASLGGLGDVNGVIFVARLDGSYTRRIGRGSDPIVSPDGTQVAFVRNEGGRGIALLVAPSAGGAAQRRFLAPPHTSLRTPNPAWFQPLGWLSGGRLLIARGDGLDIVLSNGTLRPLVPTRLDHGDVTSDVSISPRGDAVAFSVSSPTRIDVYAVPARAGAHPVQLTHDGRSFAPVYAPTGLAYADSMSHQPASTDVWFWPAGAATPHQITHTGAGIIPVAFDASGTHLLAENPAMHNGRLWSIELPGGRARPMTAWRGDLYGQGLSRDGRTVLAAIGCGGIVTASGIVEEIPFAGGAPRVVAHGPCRATWTSSRSPVG
jgi:hypothetical protein